MPSGNNSPGCLFFCHFFQESINEEQRKCPGELVLDNELRRSRPADMREKREMHSSIDIESWMSVTPAIKVQWQYVPGRWPTKVGWMSLTFIRNALVFDLKTLSSPFCWMCSADSLTNTGACLIYAITFLNLFASTRTYLRQARSLKKAEFYLIYH